MRARTAEESNTKRLTTAYSKFSSSINPAQKAKVLKEAAPLLNAHLKCREMWEALQLSDYKKEGVLNDAAIQLLFEKQQTNLEELLLVKSAEELQLLLDEDEDGFLNEDEQILLFSSIKERMQLCANELCSIYEYRLYKDLMKGIRFLEQDIIQYQGILRKRTHDKELQTYKMIGQEKLVKFQNEWEQKFRSFHEDCEEKMSELKRRHDNEIEQLNQQISRDVEFVKVKPKARIKELQVEEKLVAVNEQYAEAQKIRDELKELEITEQNRVENKILAEQETKRRKLLKKHAKEILQAQLKNQTSENKLKILKQQQYTRLEKAIKLHKNDITKNQNLAMRMAEAVGKTRDELRRTKQKARQIMEFLSDAKSIKKISKRRSMDQSAGSFTSPKKLAGLASNSVVSTALGKARSSSPLKHSLKNVTKFRINSRSTTNQPVNVVPEFMKAATFSSKTAKLLEQTSLRKSTLPPLTALYDDHLELISEV
mmetsp:Transcript_16647/g.29944  ORF Transcript_16647/g.29944 Transcript_16647/m.29944 type:complete len:484 (+) Transcript_16647:684-2135(+)